MKQEFELIIHYDRIGESDMFNSHGVGELVRCKDCKHWDNHDGGERCLNPIAYLSWAKPDSYCSYSERKEVEE